MTKPRIPTPRIARIGSLGSPQPETSSWVPLSSALAWIMCRKDDYVYEFEHRIRRGFSQGTHYLEHLAKLGVLLVHNYRIAWLQLQSSAAEEKVRLHFGERPSNPPPDYPKPPEEWNGELYVEGPDVFDDLSDLSLLVREDQLLLKHGEWGSEAAKILRPPFFWAPDVRAAFPVPESVRVTRRDAKHQAVVQAIRAIGLPNLAPAAADRLKQIRDRVKQMNPQIPSVSNSCVKAAKREVEREAGLPPRTRRRPLQPDQ